MRFQVTNDLLTSLWNRSVIVELLLREVHRSHRERNCTAVMMCDINHFKSANDSPGHAASDDLLREVSRCLRTSVRSYDMVGRYDGEEFLVVMNKCDPASAVHRAENLRQSIFSRPIHLVSSQLTVCDVEELLHHADMALYAAKASGCNGVRVAPPESTDKRWICLTWRRIRNRHCSHLECRRPIALVARDLYFFSRICSIICRIIELEPGARFSLHDSSRAQAFSIAENK